MPLPPTPAAPDTVLPDPIPALTGFARLLRRRGVAADTSRLVLAVEALSHLDLASADDVYWAGRATMCIGPDDIPKFDAAFEEWFQGRLTLTAPATVPGAIDEARAAMSITAAASQAGRSDDDADGPPEELGVLASDADILRRRDVLEIAPDELAQVHRLIGLLRPRTATRLTRRRRAGRGRYLDLRRTVRTMVRDGGEPASLARMHRQGKPRRLVLLLDVSGSMAPYSDLLLRFAHAAVRVAPTSTEVFTVGTRLTRLTRHLRARDAEDALRGAAGAIPDWSGGTRLGESLRAFLDLWGQRGTARRAIVVIASDGWERGDVDLLGEQMARLRRLAHRVIWVNPHRGREGFAPATAGMTAALPYIDDLLAGHTFGALESLAEEIVHA